jgi:hypothetical protein
MEYRSRKAAKDFFIESQKIHASHKTPILSVPNGTLHSSRHSSEVHLHGKVSRHSSWVHLDEQNCARIMRARCQKQKERRGAALFSIS